MYIKKPGGYSIDVPYQYPILIWHNLKDPNHWFGKEEKRGVNSGVRRFCSSLHSFWDYSTKDYSSSRGSIEK
jgi:hypothetical protein